MSLQQAQQRLRRETGASSGVMDSPGLGAMYSLLAARQDRLLVLNAGPLWQSLADFLFQFNCRIHVLDCFEELLGAPPPPEGEESDEDEEQAEPPLPSGLVELMQEHKFVLVLLWDVLNILDQRRIIRTIDQVSKGCKEDSLLYFYTTLRGEMPAAPSRMEFMRNEQLEYIPLTDDTLVSPDYGTQQLLGMMPGFSIKKLSMIGNGRLQENLFKFDQYREPPDANILR